MLSFETPASPFESFNHFHPCNPWLFQTHFNPLSVYFTLTNDTRLFFTIPDSAHIPPPRRRGRRLRPRRRNRRALCARFLYGARADRERWREPDGWRARRADRSPR